MGFHFVPEWGVNSPAKSIEPRVWLTVVVAKLRGLDVSQTANALGIAGAKSGGLRENFGTMTKPFQAGHAAQAGVIAVDLAALGWTASDQILEAPRGFSKPRGADSTPVPFWGSWASSGHSIPGVSIKPFPSGSLTHPG